jgi:hypothetical protein
MIDWRQRKFLHWNSYELWFIKVKLKKKPFF